MNPTAYSITANDDGKEKKDIDLTITMHFPSGVTYQDAVTFMMENLPLYMEGVMVYNKRKKPSQKGLKYKGGIGIYED